MEDERRPLVSGQTLKRPLKWLVIFCALLACTSGAMLGYDFGVTNSSLLPVTAYFQLSEWGQQLYVSSLTYAAFLGCGVGCWCADAKGRRTAMLFAGCLFFVGNGIITVAFSFTQLMIGRVVAGIAIGIVLVAEPLYTSEVVPTNSRGMLSSNVELSYGIGIFIGFVMGWLFGDLSDASSWRWMYGVSLWVPCIGIIGNVHVLPESPRWLFMNNRASEAQAVLDRLLHHPESQATYQALVAESERQRNEDYSSWTRMCFHHKMPSVMVTCTILAILSQATGISMVTYYSSNVFAYSGANRHQIHVCTVVVGVAKLSGITTSLMFVDVVGRRPLLLCSGTGMAVSMALLSLALHLHAGIPLAVLTMIFFAFFFELGFGNMLYVCVAEMFPNRFRAKGLFLGMRVARLTGAIITSVFLSLCGLITVEGLCFLFAMTSFFSIFFVFACIPEMKGIALEDAMEQGPCH